jgi:O-antigen/teichoic acid export membrane protein
MSGPERGPIRRLLSSSAYLFVSTVAGGLLGYAYQIVMGRFMSPEDYGLFMALMALVPVLSVPLATIHMSVSRRLSQYMALGQRDEFIDFFWAATIKMLVLGGVGLAGFAALSVPIQKLLASPSLVPVWLVGLYMFFVLLTPVMNAAVQAAQRFSFIAFINVFGPFAKLAFGGAFVALGWRVHGALSGLVLTGASLALIWFAYCRWGMHMTWRRPAWLRHLAAKDVFPVLLAQLAFTLLSQIDLLLAKHLFSPHDAGMYAAAATLGKAVLFLPASIVVPLFPITASESTAGRETRGLLRRAVMVTLALTVAGALFYLITGDVLVRLLFGEAYQPAGTILRLYGFAMVPMAVIMVIEHYLVAKGRLLFAYLTFLVSPLFIGAALAWHDSPLNIVWLMIASGLACLAVAGFILRGPRAARLA